MLCVVLCEPVYLYCIVDYEILAIELQIDDQNVKK